MVIGTIMVGDGPQEGISFTPDGTRLYVSNGNVNTVSVINSGTNMVIDTIMVGSRPFDLTIGTVYL